MRCHTAAVSTIDVNADLGEGFGVWTLGDDDALLGVVTSANVACGFHAGDPSTMRRGAPPPGAAGGGGGGGGGFPAPARVGRGGLGVPPAGRGGGAAYPTPGPGRPAPTPRCRCWGCRARYCCAPPRRPACAP